MQLCIDFGGTGIKLGLLSGATPVATASLTVGGTRADLNRAVDAANNLIGTHGPPSAVGIAVPGVVDAGTGRMLMANAKYAHLSDSGLDLREWGRAAFGVPAVVENDARAALAGELALGCAVGEGDVVMVILGTGIGTAAAMDGRLVRGVHGHAGILGGHVTVDMHGPLCSCGNLGCAEALASTAALRTAAPQLHGVRGLVAAAGSDPVASTLLEEYLGVWGAVVVTLCHAYDPDLVVLSGGVLRAGAAIVDPIREYVHRHLWASSHRPRFAVPAMPEFSVLKGLAALAAASNPEEEPSDGDR